MQLSVLWMAQDSNVGLCSNLLAYGSSAQPMDYISALVFLFFFLFYLLDSSK